MFSNQHPDMSSLSQSEAPVKHRTLDDIVKTPSQQDMKNKNQDHKKSEIENC